MAESAPPQMPPDPQHMLHALRQRFVAGLSDRWSQIEQPDDPDLRRQALHRLAGAAGSYGFDEIGLRARAALESIDAQPVDPAAGSQARAQSLADLRAAVRQVQADMPSGPLPT